MRQDIHEAARGRWRGILSQLGMSQSELSGKHGPCPMCGGIDRFRWDNDGGRGTFICNSCGAGNGMDLVMKLRQCTFPDALALVRPLVGLATPEPAKAGMTPEDQRRFRQSIWGGCRMILRGDPVDVYLTNRGVRQDAYPKSLRFHPDCRYSSTQRFPAMVAAIQDQYGDGVSLHRTFLQDGYKAPVDSPRMVTPGELPPGACVRLSGVEEHLGIAEGIETAFAAAAHFQEPVWAALTATLLAQWEPPKGVKSVTIYGDNDLKFGGQAAAYRLASRLAVKGLAVEVRIPPRAGSDWLDERKAA